MVFTVLGAILFYLALGNAWLASEAGTCTQGGAEELFGGALVSSALYAAATALLLARPPRPVGWYFLAPGILGIAYQTFQAADLFLAYRFQGTTLCTWKMGLPYGPDGSEALVSTWWLVMSILCIGGLLCVGLRGSRSERR